MKDNVEALRRAHNRDMVNLRRARERELTKMELITAVALLPICIWFLVRVDAFLGTAYTFLLVLLAIYSWARLRRLSLDRGQAQ